MTAAPQVPARRLTLPLALLMLVCAFSFGAIVRVAVADHFHVACVPHGFVHGNFNSDGSFYARVDPGCGSNLRTCDIYSYGVFVGGQSVAGTSATCIAWSLDFNSDLQECASTAHVASSGVFANHVHKAHNWCG